MILPESLPVTNTAIGDELIAFYKEGFKSLVFMT